MPDYVHVKFDLCLRVTEKAALVEVCDEEVWLPLSQVAPSDRDNFEVGKNGSVIGHRMDRQGEGVAMSDEYGELDEPVGSCVQCGCDIYGDDFDGSGLCDQCQWWLAQSGQE